MQGTFPQQLPVFTLRPWNRSVVQLVAIWSIPLALIAVAGGCGTVPLGSAQTEFGDATDSPSGSQLFGDIGDIDSDGDGVPDASDRCHFGDDRLDMDGDGVPDACDNCIDTWNPMQIDLDGDQVGHECDNCPFETNPSQEDKDEDGIGDPCEIDLDEDGIDFDVDNCWFEFNPDQTDTDGDGVGDACEFDADEDGIDDGDNCPFDFNPNQTDTDGDGIGDKCEFDLDLDGIDDDADNCLFDFNPNQADADGDGIGDACEFDLPTATLTITDIYGGDIIELSDGTVWDVFYTLGWWPGDSVTVDFSEITNLDADDSVSATQIGIVVTHSNVGAVYDDGAIVELFDGSAWAISFLDQIQVRLWLVPQAVVVVQNTFGVTYSLIREIDGMIVSATPL